MEVAPESVPHAAETFNQLANQLDDDEEMVGVKELLRKWSDLLSDSAGTYFEARLLLSDES